MANYQDAFISDVAITACDTPERPFEQVIEELKQKGVEISTANKDQCFIEGSVESRKVAEIDNLPGVEYVRTIFTYVADYPPGDPRDLDKVGREAE